MRSDSKNLYDILNVSSVASDSQIKRRYRQLVRKYHPDVADNKVAAHRHFIEITEAYEVLSDPIKRQAYDSELKRELEAMDASSMRSVPVRPGPRRDADRPRPKTGAAVHHGPRPVSDIIDEAQRALNQKRYGDAEAVLREALHYYPKNARLHTLLGDAYKAEKMMNAAIKSYSYAAQFDPYDKSIERKLNDLIGQKLDDMNEQEDETKAFGIGFLIVNVISWFLALFLLFLIRENPGTPFRDLMGRDLPFANGVSLNILLLTAGAACAVGFVVAANGWLGRTSEEILLESGAGKWAILPTGILAPIISVFWFPIAFIFYTVFGLLQSSLSRSVLLVFALTAAVVAVGALVYAPTQVEATNSLYRYDALLFCGNFAFPSMIVGWVMGSSITPTIDEV